MDWDVFISHAWEDKESFVRPLAEALKARGLCVWYDEFTITVGDSLRRSIDRGLANSRYGIVVLSPSFFAKEWPQKELDGLAAREVNGEKIILPVWHKITVDQVQKYSPMLAGRVAVSTSRGLEYVVAELFRAMRISPIPIDTREKAKREVHEQSARLEQERAVQERASLQIPAKRLRDAMIGLLIGLVVATLSLFPLSLLPNPLGSVLPFVSYLLFGAFGAWVCYHSARKKRIRDVTVGLLIGLVVAMLSSFPLSFVPAPFGSFLPFVFLILFGLLGAWAGHRIGRDK